jgi:hypothetical protein
MSMLEIAIAHVIVTRDIRNARPIENAEVVKVLVRTGIALAIFAGVVAALQIAAGA